MTCLSIRRISIDNISYNLAGVMDFSRALIDKIRLSLARLTVFLTLLALYLVHSMI